MERTFGEAFCTTVVGGGESPMEYYDDYVVDAAVKYLSENHEKPQFIMVGLYAPHFPYVGPEALYKKYRERAVLPASFRDPCPTPVWERHHQQVSEETALGAQAAYCAMIEAADGKMARVREAFDAYCDRKGSSRLFLYTSDHGDQCGDRSMFAKSTFYEKSAKIPLIMAGDGIPQGKVCRTPVSIMDIRPTLLEHTGASPMMDVDGVSLAAAFAGKAVPEHAVYGEFMERASMQTPADSYCFMLRDGNYKYICFEDDPECELLFDVDSDPEERKNLAGERQDVLARMRKLAKEHARPAESLHVQRQHTRNRALWMAYEAAVGVQQDELWTDTPVKARRYPNIMVGGQPQNAGRDPERKRS